MGKNLRRSERHKIFGWIFNDFGCIHPQFMIELKEGKEACFCAMGSHNFFPYCHTCSVVAYHSTGYNKKGQFTAQNQMRNL